MEGKRAMSLGDDMRDDSDAAKEAQPMSASRDQPTNATAAPAADDAIAAAAPSATAAPASLGPLPDLPSPQLQLGRVNPGKYAWRDVAELLGVSPTVPPSSLEELGEGRCGIVYGTKELAFKCARLRRRRDVDSDDDAPNLGVELWAEAKLYERLMPHNRTSGDGGPFLPRLIFAGDVNFTGVPDAEDRFQFVLVLSREGPSLDDEELQKSARALPAAACLACAALRSLQQLHANKMTHGDVREANFVLSAETASAAQLPLPLPSLSAGSGSSSSSVSSTSFSSSSSRPRVLLIDLGFAEADEKFDPKVAAWEMKEEAEEELTLVRSADCRAHPPITDSNLIRIMNLPTCETRPINWSDQKRIARNIAMREATRHRVVAKEDQVISASDSPTTGAAAATPTSPTAAAAAPSAQGGAPQQKRRRFTGLQLGRLHKGRHAWRDVAALLGVSPTVAPCSYEVLGHGRCGTVYGTKELAFKCAPEDDDEYDGSDGDADTGDIDAELWTEATFYERLMPHNGARSDGTPFLPRLIFASSVDFTGVPGVKRRFQFVLVLSRERPSLEDKNVQQYARALPAAACLACAAVSSLQQLHANKIAHCDVRSANFVLSAETAAAHLLPSSSSSSELASAAPAASLSSSSPPHVLLIDLGFAEADEEFDPKMAAWEVKEAEDVLTLVRSADCRAHPPITNPNWIHTLNLPTCAQRPIGWSCHKSVAMSDNAKHDAAEQATGTGSNE